MPASRTALPERKQMASRLVEHRCRVAEEGRGAAGQVRDRRCRGAAVQPRERGRKGHGGGGQGPAAHEAARSRRWSWRRVGGG